MSKYRVLITEVVEYEIDVEAEDQDAAEEAAKVEFLDSANPDRYLTAIRDRSYLAYEQGVDF